MTLLRRRIRLLNLRSEEGAAMAVAMIVLFVVSLLSAAAVAVATQTNGSTRRDAFKKSSLEAAEAGLQIATYRLNMLRPDDQHCVGDAVASPDTTGTCASSTYSLGNGASYQYYTTPMLGSSGSCVGLSVTSSTNLSQRCITAVGTASGVTSRSQIRTAAFDAIPLFQYGGITGVNGITDGNQNTTINGMEVTNKTINNLGGGTITGGVALGPGASYLGPTVAQQRLPSPVVLGPVDPGTSNQTSLTNCPARQTAGYLFCNDNYRIGPCTSSTPQPPNTDPCSGFTYAAATRSLISTATNGSSSLTLTGGIYNFCEIDLNNNATVVIPSGVHVEIFVDSPDDPNSGCLPGSGTFNIKNNVTWVNYNTDPTALQVYVYGWSNGLNTINFKNNGLFEGVLYAPQSKINLSHNSTKSDLIGAVSGSTVSVPNNFSFTWDSRAGTIQARSTGVYYRTAWAQCIPTYSASAPGSGCG